MKKILGLLSVVVGCCAVPAVIHAQDISQYYTVQNPEKFDIDWKAVYLQGNEMTAETQAALPHHLDMAFGDDPKQRLDLYLPKEPAKDAPVFLFLHGGGFTEGDRAHYGFIAAPFAKHGIITAVASYRLTSAGHQYPAQSEDVKNAIVWLHRNVGQYGGDPDSIFVGGHSAGAIVAAEVGVDRSWLKDFDISPDILKGIVPVSGRYDIGEGDLDAYAPTMELKRQASAARHVNDPAPGAVIAFGTLEDQYRDPSRVLEEKLQANDVIVEFLALEGQDHKDTVLSLGTEDSVLFKAVLEMIQSAE